MTPTSCPLIETGLRGVDLLAPIAVGSDVLLSGDARSGIRVLGTELAWRLASLPKSPFRVVVFLDSALSEIDAVHAEIRQWASVLPSIHIVVDASTVNSQVQHTRFITSERQAIFAISGNGRFIQSIRESIKINRSRSSAAETLTAFFVLDGVDSMDYDIRLTCSRPIAAEAIYPAVDSRTTNSKFVRHGSISERRRQIADRVRHALNEVNANLYEGAINDPNWFFNTDPAGRVAVQLLCFISQPFFTAEPYTGLKGSFVSEAETVGGFEAIIAGQFSHLMPRDLRFKNTLANL